MVKAYRWYVRFPTQFHSNNLDFKRPVDEKTARKEIREYLGTKRVPRGTEVYPGKKV